MGFASYHPAINALYFAVVILTTLWWNHPFFTAVSFVCALAYAVKLARWKAALFAGILLALIAVYDGFYATFWHFGVTVVGHTSIGNAITLEAILNGLEQGFQIAAALLWCLCLFKVFTTDKVVYLLGRVSPRLSLFAAIILRMAPHIAERARIINIARTGIGKGASQGNLLQKARHGIALISSLISWFIEHCVELSTSMQSRGSLLRKRAAFSLYRFDNRDRSLVIVMVLCMAVLGMGFALDQMTMLWAPRIIFNPITPLSVIFYGAYAVFCLMPLILQISGELSVKRSLAHSFGDAPTATLPLGELDKVVGKS